MRCFWSSRFQQPRRKLLGQSFYERRRLLQIDPTYGQSVGETISDEWNEYILYTGQDDWHVEWVQEAFDKWQTNYPTNRGNGRFKNQFGVAGSEGTDLGPAPDVSDPFGTGPTCSTASPTDGACVGYERK